MEKYNFDDYTFVYELFKYIYQKMSFDDLDLSYENVVPYLNFNMIDKEDFPKVELYWEIFLDLVVNEVILNIDATNSVDVSLFENSISDYLSVNNQQQIVNNNILEKGSKDESKTINSFELYSFFVDSVNYFGFNAIPDVLEKFIDNDNKTKVINNDYLNELFEIFKMINFKNTYYEHDYVKLRYRLWNEFDRFNMYLKDYNVFIKTYKNIERIPKSNDELFIVNLVDYELRNTFIKQDILKVKDFKCLNLANFKQFFNDKKLLEKIDEVVSILSISFADKIQLYIAEYFGEKLKQTELTVLQYRAQKYTLKYIGDKLNLTRERIRQIEAKSKRKIEGFVPKINTLLSGSDLDRNFITLNVLRNHLNEYTDLYLSLTDNKYENCNLIGLTNDSESYFRYFSKIIKKQNAYYHEKEVIDLLNILLNNSNFYISQEHLIEIFESIYAKTGQYYFKDKQNLPDKYLIIMKYHFNARQVINLEMMENFKEKYFEIFEEEDIFEREGRAILTRLIESPEIFLVERGTYKYISKDTIDLDEKLYSDMYSFIKKRENVLAEYLFKIFKDRLIPIVNNRYELHGKLKEKYSDLYFSKDTIGIEKKPTVDVELILERYIEERNGRFDLDDLLIDLPMLSGRDMGQYLTLNEEYLPMFNRKFIHKDYLDIENKEIELLIREIDNIFEYQDVINGQIILNLMKEFTPDLVRRNNVTSNVYAFHIFRVFLNTDHILSYPDIVKTGIEIDTKISFYERNKYIIDEINTKSQIHIKNIYTIANKANINIFNMKEFLEYFYANGYMRINDSTIAKKELVINENARRYVNEIEYAFLSTFNNGVELKISELNFEVLPKGINWNNHLLAHLLMSESKRLRVKTIGTQYTNLDYILEVDKNE